MCKRDTLIKREFVTASLQLKIKLEKEKNFFMVIFVICKWDEAFAASLFPAVNMEGPLKMLSTRTGETLGSNSNQHQLSNPNKDNTRL